jgi:RNA 2',3'-cyclic 3'-phosphodiesterase
LSLRVFAALELPPELQRQLAEVQTGFRALMPGDCVRWVRPEGIHLTLKFYGEVPAEQVSEIEAGLSRAAALADPIHVSIGGLGVFPNPRRPQVIWTAVQGDLSPLQGLQAAVDREALALGFKPEARAFTPHLTLGRVRAAIKAPEQERLIQALAEARVPRLGAFYAGHLSLMRSELGAGGSQYTRMFAASLKAAK